MMIGKQKDKKPTKLRTGWKKALMKVRECLIENPYASLNSISKKTGICWETVRDCVKFYSDIGFLNCSKCNIWADRCKERQEQINRLWETLRNKEEEIVRLKHYES